MNDKQKAIASKFLGGDKVKTIIIIAGFLGIGLIFLSTLSGNLFSGESDHSDAGEFKGNCGEYSGRWNGAGSAYNRKLGGMCLP